MNGLKSKSNQTNNIQLVELIEPILKLKAYILKFLQPHTTYFSAYKPDRFF
jgi:hypothetical protein